VWNIGAFNPCGGTASTNDILARELTSYPNPVNSELIVSIAENELKAGISYAIINALGQEITRGKMDSTSIYVDLLPAGVYYLQLRSASIQSSLRFVKE
jgi:hypothetical protein